MQIDWPLVLAFAKLSVTALAAISWPGAILAIAFRFRVPIAAAIGRTRKVSAFGVDADLLPNSQLIGEGENNTELARVLSVATATVSPFPTSDEILSPKDEYFRGMIDKEPLNADQKYAWAIRIASLMLMNAEHERTYRLIYGSQIAFVRQLNSTTAVGVEVARQFFLGHRDPSIMVETYNFDAWIGFLISHSLVAASNLTADGPISATAIGRSFLNWMVAQGASDGKPL